MAAVGGRLSVKSQDRSGAFFSASAPGAPIVGWPRICEHEKPMDTPTDRADATPERAPAESETPVAPALGELAGAEPAPSTDEQPARPSSFFKLERGDLLPFCLLIGFSAWLWSHASDALGNWAAVIGAAFGLVIAFVVRTFC